MTIAVCVKCGKRKFGAFSPCDECGFEPKSSTEEAKSILLSDHHQTLASLDVISETIRYGRPVICDPVALAIQVRTIDCLEADPDALQCDICGKDVDSFQENLCANCRGRQQ